MKTISLALMPVLAAIVCGCEQQASPPAQTQPSQSQTNQVQPAVPADPENPANPANALLTATAEDPSQASGGGVTNTNLAGIVRYGNNVYYFPFTDARFGNSLSAFLLNHRDLEVSAMAPKTVRMNRLSDFNGREDASYYQCDWGAVGGYFVTFRPVKP